MDIKNTFFEYNCSLNHPKQSSKNKINFKSNIYKDTIEIEGTQTKAKIFTNNVDKLTRTQIGNICSHPAFKDLPIRIMPDTHAGKSTVVGFTAPLNINNKIIPGILGRDIGCGMLCCEINTNNNEIDFSRLDDIIREIILDYNKNNDFISNAITDDLKKDVDTVCSHLNYADTEIQLSRIGTLGGGNHFIEIDCDESGKKYLIIHTGSRNFGGQIAQKYEYIASKQNPYRTKNLSYLTGDEAKQYLEDIKIAQKYAKANRRAIADAIINRMGWCETDSFESVHNYIDKDGIIRKGAIKAERGAKVIIPLNMRDGALIATGKGNPDWNNSAPHGTGRILSRTQSKTKINIEDYKRAMEGIYSSCISENTIDEAPQAYKNSDEIQAYIQPTVTIDKKLKPIYNFKNG